MINQRKISTVRIVVVILLILASFACYTFFFMRRASADDAAPDLNSAVIDKINSIDLKTDFFSDPVFMSLVDGTVSLVDQPIGKTNPFAPLAGIATPKTTTTKPPTPAHH